MAAAGLDQKLYLDVERLRKIARRQRKRDVLILAYQADQLKLGAYERAHLFESERNGILIQTDEGRRLRRVVFTGGIHRTHRHRGGPERMPAMIEFSDRTGQVIALSYWQYDEEV